MNAQNRTVSMYLTEENNAMELLLSCVRLKDIVPSILYKTRVIEEHLWVTKRLRIRVEQQYLYGIGTNSHSPPQSLSHSTIHGLSSPGTRRCSCHPAVVPTVAVPLGTGNE